MLDWIVIFCLGWIACSVFKRKSFSRARKVALGMLKRAKAIEYRRCNDG